MGVHILDQWFSGIADIATILLFPSGIWNIWLMFKTRNVQKEFEAKEEVRIQMQEKIDKNNENVIKMLKKDKKKLEKEIAEYKKIILEKDDIINSLTKNVVK